MSSILTIFFNEKILLLEGKNLIITGNNGAGKTRFLNHLTDNLKGNSNTDNKVLRDKIISEINFGIINFHSALEFEISENENLKYILNSEMHTQVEYIFSEEILGFKKQLKKKFDIFNKNKDNYFKNNSNNIKSSENGKLVIKISKEFEKKNEKYFYYYAPEHIENYVKNLNSMIDSYVENKKIVEVALYSWNKNSIYFFDSSRVSRKDISIAQFKTYDEFLKSGSLTDIEGALESYLLFKKLELLSLFDYLKIKGTKIKQINTIEKWFIKVESDLKWILEDDSTELRFTKDGNRVLIKQKNKVFSFAELSSGFKAIFNIYANLLMRAQFQDISPEDLSGIAIIDEIDVHLHISLQKKVLPFLIKAFPKVQFIVSTHSPFVITSTDKNTLVYDISSNELIKDDLSRYSYESVIKGLFHVNPISSDTKISIEILKNLLTENPSNYEKIRSIAKNLVELEKNDLLNKSLKNLYLQAINILADNNELEDLDV